MFVLIHTHYNHACTTYDKFWTRSSVLQFIHTELHECWSTLTDVDWKILPSFIMTLDWTSKMKWASEEETVDKRSKPIHAGGFRITDTFWHHLIMCFGAPIQQIQRKIVKKCSKQFRTINNHSSQWIRSALTISRPLTGYYQFQMQQQIKFIAILWTIQSKSNLVFLQYAPAYVLALSFTCN